MNGRDCDIYSVSVVFVNFKQNYQYAMDRETSVCLGWQREQSVSGYQSSGDDGFVCTRFDTEQIDFIPETVIENYNYN